jgi:6-pyruvoyltetrahydropterin/6-carboxytetrahydropterin synthase
MVELRRTVRLCVNDAPAPGAEVLGRSNGFAGVPAMRGLGRYYEIEVEVAGEPEAQTGYLLNIREIDLAVRGAGLAVLEAAARDPGGAAATPMGSLLRRVSRGVSDRLKVPVRSIELRLTPWLALGLRSDAMDEVTIRHSYEFAAAHRLHVPSLSEAQNRAVFGKCNNPSGHGHNYRVEVEARCPIDPAGHVLAVDRLDDAILRSVIEPLDHKHLNLDVPAFKDLNPSVEHIARVVFGLAQPAVRSLGCRLDAVTVWETQKTACTYRGPAPEA